VGLCTQVGIDTEAASAIGVSFAADVQVFGKEAGCLYIVNTCRVKRNIFIAQRVYAATSNIDYTIATAVTLHYQLSTQYTGADTP